MTTKTRLRLTPMVLSLALSILDSTALSLTFAHAWGRQPPPPVPQPPLVLRIPFDGREDLRALARRLDIWEVHHDEGYMVALVGPAEQAWLAAEGRAASVDPRSFHPDTIPGYPCYRTIEELYADLDQVVADHPDIAEKIDLGDSYEGRDIWVLRITNHAVPGTKPILFLMANIHGRELITNEAAMVFIDYLTDNYGVQPDVTWLVDHHEVHVSVSTNPDGHVKNEPGQPWAWWRKNTNPENGWCGGTDYGVDLNRNSTFLWNCCGGSSGDPCAETYRGPSAGSESETQAVESYVSSIFPDQREDPLDAAAPLTATGVLLTLHSYGNLVLWPWGMYYSPPPNAAGLSALGRKMATYNGYTPEQSSYLYPTDGCTDDWSYGELGVASYTFEIGSSSFYPSCSRYDGLIQPNIPAFLYAAKVARTPYLTSHGPDARELTVTPAGGMNVLLTALIDDRQNGGQVVAAAEYYVDLPPWQGGVPAPMAAEDGAFDESVEPVAATLHVTGLSPGRYLIFVRGQDDDGYWGPFSGVFLDVPGGPLASFVSSSPDTLGQTTVFTDTTSFLRPPAAYAWDFGDGITSLLPGPTHTYAAPGTYTVTLSVSDTVGTDTFTGTVLIWPLPDLSLTKAANPSPVEAGRQLTYTLVVRNDGGPASGVVVSDVVPAHTAFAWADNGGALVGDEVRWSGLGVEWGSQLAVRFGLTVSCVPSGTVITNDGYGVVTSTEGVTASPGPVVSTLVFYQPPQAGFLYTPLTPTAEYPVVFTNTSLYATSYAWDFGDGGSSIVHSPVYTFAAAGWHTVSLTATDRCGSDTYRTMLYVAPLERKLFLPLIAKGLL